MKKSVIAALLPVVFVLSSPFSYAVNTARAVVRQAQPDACASSNNTYSGSPAKPGGERGDRDSRVALRTSRSDIAGHRTVSLRAECSEAWQSLHSRPHRTFAADELLGDSLADFPDGLLVQPFDTPSYTLDDVDKAPYADYELMLKAGKNLIELRTLPTLHIYEGRDARFAVKVGSGKPVAFSIHTEDFSAEWRWNVLRGYASRTVEVEVAESGRCRLRFYFMDPGIVLQKIRVNEIDDKNDRSGKPVLPDKCLKLTE